MLKNDIEKLVDKLHDDFVSRLERSMPNIRQILMNNSPFGLFDTKFDSSRERILFRSDKSIDSVDYCKSPKDLADVIQAMKCALNNNEGYDRYRSFTSSLPIALFKYNAKQLSVIKDNVNCIMLSLVVNGFSWIDMDDDGSRYFQGNTNVLIPLRSIFDKEACKYIIFKELANIDVYADGNLVEDMYDLDSIDSWRITGFIIDISKVGKNTLRDMVSATNELLEPGLKPVISHVTDKEHIVYIDDTLDDVSVCEKTEYRSEVVDCIKVYYLLRIFERDFGAKYYKESVLQNYDNANEIFEYIDNYLAYKNLDVEKDFIDDFLFRNKIGASIIDDMLKGCLNRELIGVEAYNLYASTIKGREY